MEFPSLQSCYDGYDEYETSDTESVSDRKDKMEPSISADTINIDENDYLLLHSLGVSPSVFDRLFQELLKFHENKVIQFTRGNNKRGSLVMIPSCKDLRRYHIELSQTDSFVDYIVHIMSKNCSTSEDKCVECLLRVIFVKFEESFINIAFEKGLIESNETKEKTMDEVSTEAMIQEANISIKSARVISRHLRQFLGESIMASEKRRKYFGHSDLQPIVKRKIMEDKTIIPYWCKRPDEFIQKELCSMIDVTKLKDLTQLDIAIGGDHGGGKFRVGMKTNFHFFNNQTESYVCQLASVEFSKDDTKILKETVLDPTGEGLSIILDGKRFIVDEQLRVTFSSSTTSLSPSIICNCVANVFLVGDLMFYIQMLGREGMSSYWCMWCKVHPSKWAALSEAKDDEVDKGYWTLDAHKCQLEKLKNKELKTAAEIKGIVSELIWPIEQQNYIFPQLHFEIGVVNMVLDNFYGFIEDRIEHLSPEEKIARNKILIAESALTEAKSKLENRKNNSYQTLCNLRLRRKNIQLELNNKTINAQNKDEISREKNDIDTNISSFIDNRKELELEISTKRRILGEKKKDVQNIQKEKKKIDRPVSAEIENILIQYNISAAAYHGGKLNGVDCRRLIIKAKEIFPRFQLYLHSIDDPDRCPEEIITETCSVYCNICATLDIISSKIRLKYQEPNDDDYSNLSKALENLEYLWKISGMSYTPKIHGVLVHALEQMKRLNGIGDILEDDIEHMHQTSARIEFRMSRIKNKSQQALVHSRIEHVQNSHAIKAKLEMSQKESKRNFKNRNDDLDSGLKKKKMKLERDSSRLETLDLVGTKPHQTTLEPIKYKQC